VTDPTRLERPRSLPQIVRSRLNGSAWAIALLVTIEVATSFLSDELSAARLIAGSQASLNPPLYHAVWMGMIATLLIATTALWIYNADRRLSQAILFTTGVVTGQLFVATVLVVVRLVQGLKVSVATLILDSVLIFVTNVLVFALWYWLIDAAGPHATETTGPARRHFLFPQLQAEYPGWAGWTPDFLDYVFLAFTTSVAFSPTDTLPLSRVAKVLMMTQATIALITITVVAGTAINALASNA